MKLGLSTNFRSNKCVFTVGWFINENLSIHVYDHGDLWINDLLIRPEYLDTLKDAVETVK